MLLASTNHSPYNSNRWAMELLFAQDLQVKSKEPRIVERIPKGIIGFGKQCWQDLIANIDSIVGSPSIHFRKDGRRIGISSLSDRIY